jgi:hypothetical protein
VTVLLRGCCDLPTAGDAGRVMRLTSLPCAPS